MRRFPRAADHFEALEPRRLQSAAPTPGDGNDYVMLAGDVGKPVVSAMPEAVKRTPLPGGFKWFDATPTQQLKGMVPGVVPVILDDRSIFPTGADGMPVAGEEIDEANTRALARRAAADGILVIDIENWALNVSHVGQSVVNRSIERFSQVVDWCHDEVPTLKIGIYGELPSAEVWDSTQMNAVEDTYASTGASWEMYEVAITSTMHAQWQAASDFVRPLAAKVDYLFPSLYTFYDNRDMWDRFAKAVINEARTYGKPVIPFLWSTYHDSTQLENKPIEPDFWAQELDTVEKYADGAALWDNVQYGASEAWVQAINARRTSDVFAAAARPPQSANASRQLVATDDAFNAAPTARDRDDRATSSRAADLLAA